MVQVPDESISILSCQTLHLIAEADLTTSGVLPARVKSGKGRPGPDVFPCVQLWIHHARATATSKPFRRHIRLRWSIGLRRGAVYKNPRAAIALLSTRSQASIPLRTVSEDRICTVFYPLRPHILYRDVVWLRHRARLIQLGCGHRIIHIDLELALVATKYGRIQYSGPRELFSSRLLLMFQRKNHR